MCPKTLKESLDLRFDKMKSLVGGSFHWCMFHNWNSSVSYYKHYWGNYTCKNLVQSAMGFVTSPSLCVSSRCEAFSQSIRMLQYKCLDRHLFVILVLVHLIEWTVQRTIYHKLSCYDIKRNMAQRSKLKVMSYFAFSPPYDIFGVIPLLCSIEYK